MDWREFTGREHRCRMVAIRGHIWRICMSWRTKRGQRSAVHGAKCINDRVRSLCHCRVESRRQRPVDVADAFQVTPTKIECRAQSESTEIFDRAEAAQCLPRSGRLRSRRMVPHAAYDAGLPVF